MSGEFPNRSAAQIGPDWDRTAEASEEANRAEQPEAKERLARELVTHRDYLWTLARRYNWWQTPDVALQFPARLVAQVMNLGTLPDINQLARTLGDDCLRQVLANAEAGQLNPRSWHYWHYRLNHVKPGHVPPLPRRRIA